MEYRLSQNQFFLFLCAVEVDLFRFVSMVDVCKKTVLKTAACNLIFLSVEFILQR